MLAPISTVGTPLVKQREKSKYAGHIYSYCSSIPNEYMYWFPAPTKKTLTVTGENKTQLLKQFQEAIHQPSKLGSACQLAVELHCSGLFPHAFITLIETIGTHVHIHNPNIGSRLAKRHRKFAKQLGFPSRSGVPEFPDTLDDDFFERKEIKNLQTNINCQLVRNFVCESVSLVTLSHQKEMMLPVVKSDDLSVEKICIACKRHKVGGTRPERIGKKNELMLALALIQRLLFYKTPKVEDAIYWIQWITKLENRCKRKKENLPCPKSNVSNIPEQYCNHWVWLIWKSIFTRLSRMPRFKQRQISDLYYLFKIYFTKAALEKRLPVLYFAMRLLKYDINNHFPSIVNNNLHLHVQACANVNTLYRNLMIKLARKSWIRTPEELTRIQKKIQPPNKKMSKTEIKKQESLRRYRSFRDRTAYLDIVPTKVAFVGRD